MKIALTKTKLRAKPSPSIQQQPNSKKRTEKPKIAERTKTKIGTHLTIIGVCTTIRPEKSRT
jgi:hypothetical protein